MRAPCHLDKITVNVDDYHNENDHNVGGNDNKNGDDKNNNGW